MGDEGVAAARRRRRVRLLQRWLINPPLILAVRLGLYPGHALLETIGRRTGRTRRTVVGTQRDGRACGSLPSRARTPAISPTSAPTPRFGSSSTDTG
jgi:hypothetical protein